MIFKENEFRNNLFLFFLSKWWCFIMLFMWELWSSLGWN